MRNNQKKKNFNWAINLLRINFRVVLCVEKDERNLPSLSSHPLSLFHFFLYFSHLSLIFLYTKYFSFFIELGSPIDFQGQLKVIDMEYWNPQAESYILSVVHNDVAMFYSSITIRGFSNSKADLLINQDTQKGRPCGWHHNLCLVLAYIGIMKSWKGQARKQMTMWDWRWNYYFIWPCQIGMGNFNDKVDKTWMKAIRISGQTNLHDLLVWT